MKRKWTLEIDDVHPSINVWAGKHWSVQMKMKKEQMQKAWVAALQAKLPYDLNKVEIFIEYFHPRDTVDLDNHTPKMWMDYLKKHFVDDNIKHVMKLGWTFTKGIKHSKIHIIEV